MKGTELVNTASEIKKDNYILISSLKISLEAQFTKLNIHFQELIVEVATSHSKPTDQLGKTPVLF